MKVVVTGATGFIGTALVAALRRRGDVIVVLSRDAERARAVLAGTERSPGNTGRQGPEAPDQRGEGPAERGDVHAVTADLQARGPWTAALAGTDTIVHLAGEPVAARRWDARQKQLIRDSRVESTRMLVEAIAELPAAQRPRALVSASGIDYYPFTSGIELDDDEVTERDPPSDSFLGRVCRDWEAEARAAERAQVRVVCMRTGLVLGPGGALARMATPFKLFVGGRIGGGRQWVPWIHRDDAVRAYLAALDDDRYTGPINLVTISVRNAELSRAIGEALHRPSWLPVPGFALRAAVGELAEHLLHGRRVVPRRLQELGFTWTRPTLASALAGG